MVTHMKTTIDIADALFSEAKALATREGVTVRSLVEEGLREVLTRRQARRTLFRLRDASFKGNGLQPGVDLSDWHAVSAAIYGGRGG
jgi:hypothetical protein